MSKTQVNTEWADRGTFSMVPHWLLAHLARGEIGGGAIAVWSSLVSFTNGAGDNSSADPSKQAIGERAGIDSVKTVAKHLKDLAAVGAIRIENQFTGSGQKTNAYRVFYSDPRGTVSRIKGARPVADTGVRIAETGSPADFEPAF